MSVYGEQFYVETEKISMADARMTFAEGRTNREVYRHSYGSRRE